MVAADTKMKNEYACDWNNYLYKAATKHNQGLNVWNQGRELQMGDKGV